jgi:hypothetical protein
VLFRGFKNVRNFDASFQNTPPLKIARIVAETPKIQKNCGNFKKISKTCPREGGDQRNQ